MHFLAEWLFIDDFYLLLKFFYFLYLKKSTEWLSDKIKKFINDDLYISINSGCVEDIYLQIYESLLNFLSKNLL